MRSIYRTLFYCLVCVGLWCGSVAIRRAVFHQQTRTLEGEEAPFILEAALQYRMTRQVYETGRLPEHESKVQYPDGVAPWRTYSIGAEFLYAPLARLMPTSWTLETRVRWASVGLFSLSVPIFALWVGMSFQSAWAGLAAGLLLMTSPAFVVRSSGLGLSRENLAFPFLALFLLATLAAGKAASSSRKRTRALVAQKWGWVVLAGVAAGLSQVFWDFSQYLITLWVVWSWVVVFRPALGTRQPASLMLSVTLGLTLAGLAHPYLRAQGFLFSPGMTLLYARLCLDVPGVPRLTFRKRLGLSLGFAISWVLLGRLFVTHYSHFGELFLAKIIHINRKPMEPGLLSYAQRIMWTPQLNSSDWTLTNAYFPVSLVMLLIAVGILVWRRQHLPDKPAFYFLLFCLGITLPMYVLFFRLHVFLIVFAAAGIGGMVAGAARLPHRWMSKLLPVILIIFITGTEFHRLLFFEPQDKNKGSSDREILLQLLARDGLITQQLTNRWGHPGQSYSMIQGLTEFLQTLPEPQPVLAGFGLSGNILADADLPILLHPKFETPGIRERVRAFYQHLFLEDERAFRDWAAGLGAGYYVHGRGSLADGPDVRNTPRYMVDALEPPEHAAVHVLEASPHMATWFQPIWSNERYHVYRIISNRDLEISDRLMRLAYMAAEEGDLDEARRYAWQVLSQYHWKHPDARELIEIFGPPRTRISE